MEDYYKKRVLEYEKIYFRDDPVRIKEQVMIAEAIRKAFFGKKAIEIATGTGYWTKFLSQSAFSITATDKVPETLELAKTKVYQCPVEFKSEDAYNLSFPDSSFDGGMANFWFSHVPKEKIDEFLAEFHRVLQDKAVVFLADNNYDKEVGGELIKAEGDENTYKLRTLDDGSKHKVLKNYYTRQELFSIFKNFDKAFSEEKVFYGEKFWYAVYKLEKN